MFVVSFIYKFSHKGAIPMPHIIEITDLSAPELAPYTRLTEAQLRNKLEPEKGIFCLLYTSRCV